MDEPVDGHLQPQHHERPHGRAAARPADHDVRRHADRADPPAGARTRTSTNPNVLARAVLLAGEPADSAVGHGGGHHGPAGRRRPARRCRSAHRRSRPATSSRRRRARRSRESPGRRGDARGARGRRSSTPLIGGFIKIEMQNARRRLAGRDAGDPESRHHRPAAGPTRLTARRAARSRTRTRSSGFSGCATATRGGRTRCRGRQRARPTVRARTCCTTPREGGACATRRRRRPDALRRHHALRRARRPQPLALVPGR